MRKRAAHCIAMAGALVIVAFVTQGCAVPTAPLAPEDLVRAVKERESSLAEAVQAIELTGLKPLFTAASSASNDDPEDSPFWQSSAWAYARGPVTARRRFLAAKASRGSAGQPKNVSLRAESVDFDDMDKDAQLRLTFDILGLLGLGKSAAAQSLALAQERRAYGELERAVWAARFAVDRARVRVSASFTRLELLASLLEEVHSDVKRVDLLAELGWIPTDEVAVAKAMAKRLERLRTKEQAQYAQWLAELAETSGLAPQAKALTRVTGETLRRFAPLLTPSPIPTTLKLLEQHPTLRERRLDYALAEARLQSAAAEAWPDIRLGPRLRIMPGTELLGGILDLSIPWPGSVSGHVAAAEQERELARELLEDAIVRVLARAKSSLTEFRKAKETLASHGPQIETWTRSAWIAARARFSIDAKNLPLWSDRLERRIVGVVAALDAREQAILALLRYQEVIGPLLEPEGKPEGKRAP